ncbi:retrovirus-related pol polyprotein from transposon TNT 1-94 [Tanacetum coccineum]|uniref:Retrovirus-related pol polyprotein from transposon TNT 1-94 n=1 Tax=Tanacetum coccineum TaxID=301880 RepID=A0ABQ5F3Z9_9ASTR
MADENVPALSHQDLYQFLPIAAMGHSLLLSQFQLSIFNNFGTRLLMRQRLELTVFSWMKLNLIDYAERIWEEFVQSIQTFLTDKKRLTMTSQGKKKTTPLLIPSIRLIKLIIHHLKTKHTIHLRTGSPLHYSHEDNILGNLRFVGKDGKEVFEPGVAEEEAIPETLTPKATKATKPKADMQTKPSVPQASKVTKPTGKKSKLVKETSNAPSPAKRSKAGKVTKKRKPKSPLRLVDEFVDEGVPDKEPAYNDEEANFQRAVELSLKEQEERTQGPARSVVFREPDSGRFQPLPEVQGKGREKVIEKQAAHDLLTLQTPKKKNPEVQFIFQRRTPMTTEPSGNAESPSLDAELALEDSETESDEVVTPVNKEKDASNMELTEINTGVQDKGQAGSNPGKQDEGQAGSNPGNAAEF